MSALADVKAAAGYALAGLGAIESVVEVIDAGGPADEVIGIVRAMLGAFIGGVGSGATPEQIAADLAKVRSGLGANDAAADASVDAKFGPSEVG